MLAMGATTSVQRMKSLLVGQKPWPFLIGFACQYIGMPLLGLFYALAFRFSNAVSVGIIILSVCPGGTTSQFMCYLIRGDVTLSILMTTASTTASFLLLPAFAYI